MFKHFCVVLILASFLCFLYGIKNIFVEVEDNACRMTYMFGHPQFSRVDFRENKQFPSYALYYYYEGSAGRDVNKLQLNGAPVLFVPGNGGSYKQTRSLASVALQKAKDKGKRAMHLDYFTIDYNEELTGFQGAYLWNQQTFLNHCIKKVLSLYAHEENQHSAEKKKNIVIIGHSMGGKVVQSVLMDDDVRLLINTVIFISTPLDKPVFFSDVYMYSFYKKTNEFYKKQFTVNATNKLQDVLMLSMGGGNRDLVVRPSLTSSRYRDLHVMTSSIPTVWLSCDHLSVVWCLQLMLVINRFLFSILSKSPHDNFVNFNVDKNARLQAAQHLFVHSRQHVKGRSFEKDVSRSYTWHEDARRIFGKKFLKSLKEPFHQLLPLTKIQNNNNQPIVREKLYVDVFNVENNDWIYGCTANEVSPTDKHITCNFGTPLAHFVEIVPTRSDKYHSFALLDLHNLRKTYANWTHIVMRLPPTENVIRFNVDTFNAAERAVRFRAPHWYAVRPTILINETLQNSIYYRLQITDLVEPFITFSINIDPIACKNSQFYVTSKLSVPWAQGFERFSQISHESEPRSVYVNVPTAAPNGFNTTANPVVLETFLDPNCRYSISYNFEIGVSMSRLVLEFYTFLPAHLVAVLLIVLKNQVLRLHAPMSTLRTIKPYLDFFQYTSIYIVTGARLFKGLLMSRDDPLETRYTLHTFYASLAMNCMAIVCCILLSIIVWLALMLQGNFFLKIISRFTRTSMSTSSAFVTLVSYLPISFGVVVVALALGTCGGMAAIISCAVYFILISDSYKDYLQDLMLKVAASLLKKMRKSRRIGEEEASGAAENKQPLLQEQDEVEEVDERCQGMQNFAFHMTLFLLLCMHALINVTSTIAWMKNYKSENNLPDPSLIPSLILIGVLSLLWQLKAPRYYSTSVLGNVIVALILYMCASAAIVFCQDASYRLSYIIAFVYIIILCNELSHRWWQMRYA